MPINYKFIYWVRAVTALTLIVSITFQLCLAPNLSKYLYSEDSKIEKLDKIEKTSDAPGIIIDLIYSHFILPHISTIRYETIDILSYTFRLLPASHSIRSPPLPS